MRQQSKQGGSDLLNASMRGRGTPRNLDSLAARSL
jgi:hypothetical protein